MNRFLMKSLSILFLSFLILTGFRAVQAQTGLDLRNGEDLIIRLVTIGQGDDLTSWWGHNAIIVEDTVQNKSYFYNYGLFSFGEDFVANFVKGRLTFWVGAVQTEYAMAFYINQNRSIRIQTLNLLPEKRLELALKLEENIRPENREYLYHHYDDNCATRVRDLIDRAIDGQLRAYTAVPGEMTLRELTRRFTHHQYIWTWLLMFPMNDSIDQPIERWDDMFLPREMEKIFNEMVYTDISGTSRPLVIQRDTVYVAPGREPIPDSPPNFLFRTVLISLLLSLGVLLAAYLDMKGKPFLFGFLNFVIGGFMGILGLFLTIVSLFTDHTIAYYNENLFLTNPVSAIIPLLAIFYLFRKSWAEIWLRRLWYFHLAMTGLLLILKLLPNFDQDNSLALATFIPLYLTFAGVFYWKQKKQRAIPSEA